VSIDECQCGCPLFFESFQAGNFTLMGLQKSVAVDIGKGRGELKHLILAKV
jgi:hypothetical protein